MKGVESRARPMLRLLKWPVLSALALLGTSAPALAKPCKTNCFTPGDYTVTIPSNGMQRSYVVHVPASYTGQAVPLLVDLHGLLADAATQRKDSGQLEQSDARGFIAVWPEGYQKSFNGYNCCGEAQATDIDDVAFLRAVIADVKARSNINNARVYMTGMSNGGVMAMRFACEAADQVKAIGAFSQMLNRPDLCHPSRPVTVVEVHGLLDPLAPYVGNPLPGWGFASARQSWASWATINYCSGEPVRTQLSGLSRSEFFISCAGGVEVGLVTLATANHFIYQNTEGFESAIYLWENVFNR